MAAQTPQAFPGGPGLQDGTTLNRVLGAGLRNYSDAIVAHAGGGTASATQLVLGINNVPTVATSADSLVMPQSVPGGFVMIVNGGVASATVYANPVSALPSGVLDTLNGTAGATGISVANGKTALLFCTAFGAWVGPVALA